jgi:hypothetical protein
MELTFTAPLWLWSGKAAWHFITVPEDHAGMIRMAVPRRAGFGAVKVKARIGVSQWSTSIFPDSKSGTYLLPIKADVRKREGLGVGDEADVSLFIDV